MPDKKQILLFIAVILVGLGLLFVFQSFENQKLRLIACDVGQGDGMVIVSENKQVVVDGGRGQKMADCLGRTLPFYDREIEVVVLTHPQQDHLEGLLEVLARYDVETIVTTGVKNETGLFDQWEQMVKDEGARVHVLRKGDRFILAKGTELEVLWPTSDLLSTWRDNPPSELNDSSIVIRLNSENFCAYLTGDLDKGLLEDLIDRRCQVLKVSHHGSRTGTNEEILERVKPEVAVIQVGKNSYGHPHKEVIDLLVSKGVKIFRNDINGIIEVEIEGGEYKVESEK